MRVVRGRGETIAEDRAATRKLVAAAADGEPGARVWRPHRQVAFGRRDANEAGYEEARRQARERGYPPVERSVGGRAVPYEGSTIAFARATPTESVRGGIEERYRAAIEDLTAALAALGVEPERGEPEAAFCPGTHSLSVDGRKVAGVAQRVTADAALVGGVVIPRDRRALADVLEAVYDALDVPLDPATVGSIAAGGGEDDPEAVRIAIEEALVGDREARVETVAERDTE